MPSLDNLFVVYEDIYYVEQTNNYATQNTIVCLGNYVKMLIKIICIQI